MGRYVWELRVANRFRLVIDDGLWSGRESVVAVGFSAVA